MIWNYRMIKVDQEGDKEIGMVAEVIYNDQGEIEGFAKASIISISDLEMIHKDVQSQEGKLMTYFWDNGTFTHDAKWNGDGYVHTYHWQPHPAKTLTSSVH